MELQHHLLFLVLICMNFWTFVRTEDLTQKEKDTNLIHKLFTSLDKKESPLYTCRGWFSGIPWKVPARIQCPLVPTDKPSKVVKLTFYWPDLNRKPVTAWECFSVQTVNTKRYFFWGSYTEETKSTKAFISKGQCREMVSKLLTPTNKRLERIQERYYGYTQTPEAEWVWPVSTKAEATSYYFVELKITHDNSEAGHIHTTTKITEDCRIKSGACPTELGILVWEPPTKLTCQLKTGITTHCIMTGERISCPEAEIAMTNVFPLQMCDLTFGGSEQGIIFSQSKVGEISPAIGVTEFIQINLNYRRPKRNIPSIMSAEQMNAKFQFLYDLVRDNTSYSIHLLHAEVCRTNQRQLEILRTLAEGGNPTLLVRTLLGNPKYRAALNGDVFSIWKCEEIYNYMFLPRNSCIVVLECWNGR